MIENSLPHGRHIPNKPQPDKDRAGFPGFPADWGIGEQRCVSINAANIRGGRNDRVTVLDVFSWLPAKEISIEELEQIFIGHLNGTYKGNTRYCWKCRIMQIRTSLTVGQR